MKEYGGVDGSEGKHTDVVVAPVVLEQAVQLAVCRKWQLGTHILMQGCIEYSQSGLTQWPAGTQLCCAGLQTGREVTQRWG